jgi:3-oxoacyl-[acyl-carrier protein] reductase
MDLDLAGKHALVCGASEGIGRAAAHELALLGCDVTVLARRAEVLQEVAAALPRRGAQQHGWIAADVAQTATLRAQAEALAAGKPVHILVNNTGGPPGGPAHGAAVAAFEDAFGRHLIANHALVQALLPGMRAAGFGRIVNVISTSVREPIPNLGVSNTIRGAVASWAKTLSRELAPFGITVNNVLPGYTETARLTQIIRDRAEAGGKREADIAEAMRASVPAGRFARPEEIGGVIAFLCAPAAAYVTGVSLAVDGGRMQSI